MMRKLLLLAAIALAGLAFARDGRAEKLRYGTIPVDFVDWQAASPSFAYDDLKLGAQRAAHLKAEGHAVAERLSRIDVHMAADGSVEQTSTFSSVYLTQVGIQQQGNFNFWVDSHSEVATIEQAYTLLPDGRRQDVDPGTVQLVIDTQDDIFTDYFNVFIPFVGLEPGAITVVVAKTRTKPEAKVLPWSRIYYPQFPVPLEQFELRVTWDEGVAEPRLHSDSDVASCRRAGVRALRCSAERIPAYPTDPDVSYLDVVPYIIVAEPASWDRLAAQMRGIVDSAIHGDGRLQQILERQLQGARTKAERLDRIHRFVSQNIRYLGLEQGVGGIVPRPTNLTLDRGFGDCKDKTALFIDMARRAGFDAYAVLTSTDRFEPAKLSVPAASYFNHMVACVHLSQSQEYCVDLTNPYSSYDTSLDVLGAAVRLDLVKSPKPPSAFAVGSYLRDKTVRTETTLALDGSLEERQTAIYDGAHGAWARAFLQGLSREDRTKHTREQYDKYYVARAAQSFEFEGLENVSEPVKVRSIARFAKAYDPANLETYEDFEVWLGHEAMQTRTGNTSHDYRFSGLRFRGETVYHLPRGLGIAHTGPRLNFDSPYGTLQRAYRVSAGELRVVTDLVMPRATIPIGDVEKFNGFLEQVYGSRRIWFTVER